MTRYLKTWFLYFSVLTNGKASSNTGADKWKYCAFCEESTILTGWVDFGASMNIRYGGIREINAKSQKFGISDILL
jgi:hypothetical protein